MLQGDSETSEGMHGEFEVDIHLTSLVSNQTQELQVFWRDEEEATRFHSPFTAETSFPFSQEESPSFYKIQIGGFHGPVIWSPHVYNCPEPLERQTPAVLTVLPHSSSEISYVPDMELFVQVLMHSSHIVAAILMQPHCCRHTVPAILLQPC